MTIFCFCVITLDVFTVSAMTFFSETSLYLPIQCLSQWLYSPPRHCTWPFWPSDNDFFSASFTQCHCTCCFSGFRNDTTFKNVIAVGLISQSVMKPSPKMSLQSPLFPDLQWQFPKRWLPTIHADRFAIHMFHMDLLTVTAFAVCVRKSLHPLVSELTASAAFFAHAWLVTNAQIPVS